MLAPGISGLQQTTSHKVVMPFYAYAAISLLIGCVMLLFNTEIFAQHHFLPRTLAITHIMALGWGTMVIFGASYQLLPVIIEGKLYSNLIAYLSFGFAAIGIPILIFGFYQFHTGWLLQSGAILVNIATLLYLTNVIASVYKSEKREVRSWFVITASVWLFSTTFFGLLLVLNFNESLLPSDSLSYLSIHAHMGLIGWFLLLVIGVGSRLIPMFLISMHNDNKILWFIYGLINTSLISFILFKSLHANTNFYYISLILALAGIGLFGMFCRKAYKVRIRKLVDDQMKISLLSVIQMLLPILVLIFVLALMPSSQFANLSLLYGFCIFFGWITAIIFGMTFKTLPFIVWNKVYHKSAHKGKTPAPKELFNEKVYKAMMIAYLTGFGITVIGILITNDFILKIGTLSLLISAILYAYNSAITLFHKPIKQ